MPCFGFRSMTVLLGLCTFPSFRLCPPLGVLQDWVDMADQWIWRIMADPCQKLLNPACWGQDPLLFPAKRASGMCWAESINSEWKIWNQWTDMKGCKMMQALPEHPLQPMPFQTWPKRAKRQEISEKTESLLSHATRRGRLAGQVLHIFALFEECEVRFIQ